MSKELAKSDTRQEARQALEDLLRDNQQRCTELTLDEINEEIRAYRRERQEHSASKK